MQEIEHEHGNENIIGDSDYRCNRDRIAGDRIASNHNRYIDRDFHRNNKRHHEYFSALNMRKSNEKTTEMVWSSKNIS